MKKIAALLVATIMVVCSIPMFTAAAESSFLGEETIPYAVYPVKIDGKLSDWGNAAKFELPANKMSPVSGTPASDMYIDVYMMWDETYLYVASEVNDTNNGRLVRGNNGDTLSLFLDIDETIAGLENKRVAKEVTIADNKGIVRQSGFKIVSFPVSAEAGNDTAVGFITKYGADDHEDCSFDENLKLIGTDAACSSDGTKWIIEQRVKWADLKSLYDGIYGTFEMAMPGIKAGTVVTFMPSYNDCGSANTQVGWYLGKNGALEAVQINPVSYGFKGTLGAKPAYLEYYLVTAPTLAAKGLFNRRSYKLDDKGEKVVIEAKLNKEDTAITFEDWYLRTMVQSKAGENGKLDVRFVSMLDENIEDYEEAGFEIDDGTTKVTVKTTEANNSFIADGKTVTIGNYSEENDYFFLAKNVFASEVVAADPEITVTPYIYLADGSRKITGASVTFHLSDLK